jgi:hypothetical protein
MMKLIKYSTKLEQPEVIKENPSPADISEYLNKKPIDGEMYGLLDDCIGKDYFGELK